MTSSPVIEPVEMTIVKTVVYFVLLRVESLNHREFLEFIYLLYHFYNFNDIHVYRAAFETASAAYTTEQAFVSHRVVNKLVNKALAASFILCMAWVFCSHLSKIREHTRVPAADLTDTISGIKVAYIKTHTGRADVSTSSTAYTCFANLVPDF